MNRAVPYRSIRLSGPPGSAGSGRRCGPAAAAGVPAGSRAPPRAAAPPGCTGSRGPVAGSLPGTRTHRARRLNPAAPARGPPMTDPSPDARRAVAAPAGPTPGPAGRWWRSPWSGTRSREVETCRCRNPGPASSPGASRRWAPPDPSCSWGGKANSERDRPGGGSIYAARPRGITAAANPCGRRGGVTLPRLSPSIPED